VKGGHLAEVHLPQDDVQEKAEEQVFDAERGNRPRREERQRTRNRGRAVSA